LQRRAGGRLTYDDLVQTGREGLIAAAQRYDPAHGVEFGAWATLRVRGAMIDAIRASSGISKHAYQKLRAAEAADRVQEVVQEELAAAPPANAEAADARLSDYLAKAAAAMALGFLGMRSDPDPQASDDALGADEQLAREEERLRLRRAVDTLPDLERKLLIRHYFDGAPFIEAAAELGLSKSWASRLHTRALESLFEKLRET
jgi:RNA polymerase sigma factor for flagellar operon FliA